MHPPTVSANFYLRNGCSVEHPNTVCQSSWLKTKKTMTEAPASAIVFFVVFGSGASELLWEKQLLLDQHATLLDAGFLAGETAEVVKLGAANLTVFVYGDRVNEG